MVAQYALRGAYAGQCTSIKTRPGRTEPSAEEVWDLITSTARSSGVWFDCYWRFVEGGTAETAIAITQENWNQYARRLDTFPAACELGHYETVELYGFRRHFDIRWLPDRSIRPACDWVLPAVGDRVEVEAFPAWQPGAISRVAVSDRKVTIRLDAGGSTTRAFEGRQWRRVGVQPVPSPTPPVVSKPTPTPPPPVATPTPCPTCPPAPACATCKPRCLPFDAGEGLTMRRITEGRTPSIDRLQALVRAIKARSGCWLR
jgi:hypothetical protein